MVFLSVALVCPTFGFPEPGHQGCGMKMQANKEFKNGFHKVVKFFKMLDRFDVTDQQLIELRHIFQKREGWISSMQKEMKENQEKLRKAFLGNQDPREIEIIANEQGELTKRLIFARLEMLMDIKRVLTEDQWKKIMHFAKNKQRFGEKACRQNPPCFPQGFRNFPPPPPPVPGWGKPEFREPSPCPNMPQSGGAPPFQR